MNPGFISSSNTGLGNTIIFGDCAFTASELEPSQKGPRGCTQLLAWWKYALLCIFLQWVQLPHWYGQAQGAVPCLGKNLGSEKESAQPWSFRSMRLDLSVFGSLALSPGCTLSPLGDLESLCSVCT